jgi:hypothetical protein
VVSRSASWLTAWAVTFSLSLRQAFPVAVGVHTACLRARSSGCFWRSSFTMSGYNTSQMCNRCGEQLVQARNGDGRSKACNSVDCTTAQQAMAVLCGPGRQCRHELCAH